MNKSERPYAGTWTLVTGAGKPGRVGAAIARYMAARGSNIYLHYHSEPAIAEEVKRDIAEATGALVELVSGDLSDSKVVSEIFEKISPDIVINNAAVFKTNAFDANVGANMKAVYLVTQAAIARMLQKNNNTRGTIVFVGDAFIEQGGVYAADLMGYTMSKAYVPYITRQLAAVYGKEGLRFLAVLNGPIEPPPSASHSAVESIAQEIALPAEELNPWIGGEKVAEAIDSLIQAKALNGIAVPVDGGRAWRTHSEHS